MSKHLLRDMDGLHREILTLSAMVEEMIAKATRCLINGEVALVAEVVAADRAVDAREVHVEEECLKILALHQPVAGNLRRIATVLKVNNDLERIGDLAVNIAERAQCLHEYPDFPIPPRVRLMSDLATGMVRSALDAFVNLNARQAQQVRAQDDAVDACNRDVIDELHEYLRLRPDHLSPGLHCFSAARHIERIADHATNIAEDVIYLVDGDIVRHQPSTLPAGVSK